MVHFMKNCFFPIDDHLRIDPNEARGLGSLLAEDFSTASPFPHIVIDNFLPDAALSTAVNGFPNSRLASDGLFEMGYAGQHKRQIMPEDCSDEARQLFWFFNSRPVLQFLEGLTGLDGLLPDPYFLGGGYHETTKGGLLGVHADFRVHDQLRLQRRLNMIIYLNPEWQDEWEGHLELWSRDMKTCVTKVAPLLNRCVVFQTDADTWHGHPEALNTPEGVTRRSIALYYYTASKAIYEEVPANGTVYVGRPTDTPEVQREAGKLRNWERIRDWLPPVVYRKLSRFRYR